MATQAYASATLEAVSNWTNIQQADSRTQSAAKFAMGVPLKVATVAMAALEALACALMLIPTYALKEKYPEKFSNISEQTRSAATTVLDATKALVQVKAKPITEKTTEPTEKSYRDHLNDALDATRNQLSKGLTFACENKVAIGVVTLSTVVMITAYFNYPLIVDSLQKAADSTNSSAGVDKTGSPSDFPTAVVQETAFDSYSDSYFIMGPDSPPLQTLNVSTTPSPLSITNHQDFSLSRFPKTPFFLHPSNESVTPACTSFGAAQKTILLLPGPVSSQIKVTFTDLSPPLAQNISNSHELEGNICPAPTIEHVSQDPSPAPAPKEMRVGACWNTLKTERLFSSDHKGAKEFIDHMKENWCWDFKRVEVYEAAFGKEASLYPSHQRTLDHALVYQIDSIAQNHPLYNSTDINQGGKTLGMDICEVRRSVREYVRLRGSRITKWFLNSFEARNLPCEHYWDKYEKVEKMIKGAKTSNWKYDWIAASRIPDLAIGIAEEFTHPNFPFRFKFAMISGAVTYVAQQALGYISSCNKHPSKPPPPKKTASKASKE